MAVNGVGYATIQYRKGLDLPLDDGLRLEADLTALISITEDAREGPRAFAKKREPR